MKNYIKPEIATSFLAEEIALEDIVISGDFDGTSNIDTVGPDEW